MAFSRSNIEGWQRVCAAKRWANTLQHPPSVWLRQTRCHPLVIPALAAAERVAAGKAGIQHKIASANLSRRSLGEGGGRIPAFWHLAKIYLSVRNPQIRLHDFDDLYRIKKILPPWEGGQGPKTHVAFPGRRFVN